MARRRITRQEMKHDEFVDFMTKWTILLEQHWRKYLPVAGAAAGVLVLAIGVVFWVFHSRSAARSELSRAAGLLNAQVLQQGANPADPIAPSFPSEQARDQAALQALESVASGGSGPTASLAAIYRAVALLRLSRAEEAEEAFQKALPGTNDPVLRGLIRHSLASTAEMRGDLASAEQRLRDLAGSSEKGYPKDLVLRDLARILEREGKTKEAADTRQQLATEVPDSPLNETPQAPPAAPTG